MTALESSGPGSGIPSALTAWLPLAVAVTALSLLVPVAVQQSYRQGANDPQIQLAEDAAALLEAGTSPASVVGSQQVDVAKSLAPYVVVYDRSKEPVAWSGILDGKPARPPAGVFDHAATAGQNRVSWQPKTGVRSAIVVVPYGDTGGGFVMAGRSLREVEDRESQLGLLSLAAWVATMFASLVATWISERYGGRASR